jgi:hypothetical protein
MNAITRAAALTLIALLPLACAKKPAPTPDEQPAPATRPVTHLPSGTPDLMNADPLPAQEYLIQLTAYKITVPAGSISRNDDFWKRVNETAVDVPTYELLFKNGVRVGVAQAGEWDYLKDLLNKYPAITQPSAYAGREAKDIELELKMKVPYQNLFYYNTHGELVGQTYERCDNLLKVQFQPAPRKPGTVRLALCPVLRSLREVAVAIGDIKTTSYQWMRPEQLFDLNLVADVPIDGFLVLAPSSEGRWPTSLGNTFLVQDGVAEQTETLLIFRPITFRQRTDAVPAKNP